MAHVRVKVKIAHPEHADDAIEVGNALIDTRATLTTIPRSLASRLGLPIRGQQTARTAAGDVPSDRSYALVEYDGRESVGDVLVSDTYPGVLIGVVTLESLALAVDPRSGRLVDSEMLLL